MKKIFEGMDGISNEKDFFQSWDLDSFNSFTRKIMGIYTNRTGEKSERFITSPEDSEDFMIPCKKFFTDYASETMDEGLADKTCESIVTQYNNLKGTSFESYKHKLDQIFCNDCS